MPAISSVSTATDGVPAVRRNPRLMDARGPRFRHQHVALVQGGFFLATGLWPLVHLRSFELVTGPKLEGWLVKGVGILITAIGATLVSAAVKERVTPEMALLANGAGLGLGVLDVVYVSRGRIKPIYLADAAVEALFGAAWLWSRRSRISDEEISS